MKDSFLDRTEAGASADGSDPMADYRVREVEARLGRRLSALESQRDRLSWMMRLTGAGLAGTLILLAVVLTGAGRSIPGGAGGTLVTGELVLRDGEGITRGRLGTSADGSTRFALADGDGRERIRLTVLADGSPGVTISDADARPRIVLGYLPDGTTSLVFADAQGFSRAVVGLEPDGSTHALFSDRSGRIRTLVGVDAEGLPAMSMFDEQ
jgi:hypothetical protein